MLRDIYIYKYIIDIPAEWFVFPTDKLVAGRCSSARLSLSRDGAQGGHVPLI